MNNDPECESDYESSDENMVASIACTTFQNEPKKTLSQIGNTNVGPLLSLEVSILYLTDTFVKMVLNSLHHRRIIEEAFIRQGNITFGCVTYRLLTTKQTKEESIEHFFEKLKELSEKCELSNQ